MVHLGLGANLGDRLDALVGAVAGLHRAGVAVDAVSSVYETEAVGWTGAPAFLNAVVRLRAAPPPRVLLEWAQHLEREAGRRPGGRNAPRPLDVDILLYGNLTHREAGLWIPHPRLADRRFVLVPLAEVSPGVVHPESGLTAAQLLAQCPDRHEVRRHCAWPVEHRLAGRPGPVRGGWAEESCNTSTW